MRIFIKVIIWLAIAIGYFFAMDHFLLATTTARNTTIYGHQVGGMKLAEARSAIESIHTSLETSLYTIVFNEQLEIPVALSGDVLNFKTEEVVDRVFKDQFQGTLRAQFSGWVRSWFASHDISLVNGGVVGHIEYAVRTYFNDMSLENAGYVIPCDIPTHPSEDEQNTCWSDYFSDQDTRKTIRDISLDVESHIAKGSIANKRFHIGDPAFLAHINDQLLYVYEAPISMRTPDGQLFTLKTQEELHDFFLNFETDSVPKKLADFFAPSDAKFNIKKGDIEVAIIESKKGYGIDWAATRRTLLRARKANVHEIPLDHVSIAEPKVSTEDLNELGINHLVSQFTTYHGKKGNRVQNIQRVARMVDEQVISPGQTFNLNTFLGERTTQGGFLPAAMILKGKLVDSVGGGISQFATTFYNAIFWGGYQDVQHKAHSIYFSRYPEGIEATISWPWVHLIFKNNDDSPILIKTFYTPTSITVAFYGDNSGRVVIGDKKNGVTSMITPELGSEESRIVTGSASERFNFIPASTEYVPNISAVKGIAELITKGSQGWTTTVSRQVREREEVTLSEAHNVKYSQQSNIYHVNPCNYINQYLIDLDTCDESRIIPALASLES